MTTFGKVLVFVTFLAALGFLALAITDYGKREGLSTQIQLESFMIEGLPVDDAQRNADGDLLVNYMGKQMQQALFSGGSPVATQKAGVDQRHTKLMSDVDAAAGPEQKTRIKEIVLPFAHSAMERATLEDEIQRAQGADLGSTGKFFASGSVYEKAYSEASSKTLAFDARREAIAHYLFCTSIAQPDYQFTMSVAGLDQYAREVERHGTALRSMVPEIELAMAADRGSFETHHRELIEEIVRMADLVRHLQEDLEKQKVQLGQYNTLIADRTRDIEDLNKRIETTTAALQAALAQQTEYERALFEAQKTIATTSEANQKLEGDIKNRELGTLSAPK